MRRTILLLVACAALTLPGASQTVLSKRNTNWLFQHNRLDFSSTAALPDTGSLVLRGIACISDSSGNLLGYLATSDGFNWFINDSANATLPGLSAEFHMSSGGSYRVVFVPKPANSDSVHLVFLNRPAGTTYRAGLLTLRFYGTDQFPAGIKPGVQWFAEDVAACMFATPTADSTSYWMVFQPMGSNSFHSYRLTASGLDPTPITSSAGPVRGTGWRHGHLVSNVAGNRFVNATRWTSTSLPADTLPLELYSLDPQTGIAAHLATLPSQRAEGIEFSASGRFLYVLEHHHYLPLSGVRLDLVQFDMEATDIPGSRTLIHTYVQAGNAIFSLRIQLALGIDGRIYRVHEVQSDTMGVIMNPDQPGMLCNYVHDALVCPSSSFASLPTPIKRYLDSPSIITGAPSVSPEARIAVAPQPMSNVGWLAHPALQGRFQLEWRDAAGRLVRSETISAESGRAQLDASVLPAGSYVLRVHSMRLNAPLVVRVLVAR